MGIKEIVSKVAQSEKLRVQVAVGNIREIVGILSDMIYLSSNVGFVLYENGRRRSKKRKVK